MASTPAHPFSPTQLLSSWPCEDELGEPDGQVVRAPPQAQQACPSLPRGPRRPAGLASSQCVSIPSRSQLLNLLWCGSLIGRGNGSPMKSRSRGYVAGLLSGVRGPALHPGPCFPWVGCRMTRGAPKFRAPFQGIWQLEGHDPCLGRGVMLLSLGLAAGQPANGTCEPQGLRVSAMLGLGLLGICPPVPHDPEALCTC